LLECSPSSHSQSTPTGVELTVYPHDLEAVQIAIVIPSPNPSSEAS